MKLRTRLIIAFITIIMLPMVLAFGSFMILVRMQVNSIEETYGVSEVAAETLSNPIQIMVQTLADSVHSVQDMIEEDPGQMEDATCLEKCNQALEERGTYLLVRKDETIIFIGSTGEDVDSVLDKLPKYGETETLSAGLYFLDPDGYNMFEQIDFRFPGGEEGSAFVVRNVLGIIPENRQFLISMIVTMAIVLIITAILLLIWIYRGIVEPLGVMQVAANNIKEGNLDFELHPNTNDEMGELTQSLEDMRKRLKDDAEEKVENDQKNRDLISNISHDLRTPVTTIKGYAEGIIDGVADTPDKVDKYIRTIYNKADEMERLINELTEYSRIDTNRIPYNFAILSVDEFFNDCAEDLSTELESKNVEFNYYNYVTDDVRVIADAEQISRVIHNIINNSLKYMDKKNPKINLRVKDVGDFIQVEIEDNGRGIAAKDLPNIFDRFYRTDTSRNSAQGGSGIGLSVVKKIIEEHGGKVWATSKEGIGTTMYFVLRKYQEVPVNE